MNSFKDFLSSYSFDLPKHLIAKEPVHPADSCRLLYIDKNKTLVHSQFHLLTEFLQPNDLLVVNNTKVEARRVFLKKINLTNKGQATEGARLETIFLQEHNQVWQVLMRGSRKVLVGQKLTSEIDSQVTFKVVDKKDGMVFLESSTTVDDSLFSRIGQMPIPPYLNREQQEEDKKNYQSIFSVESGSVAAPTASLHFTSAMLKKLEEKSIQIAALTLHVGYGTFSPVQEKHFIEKKLHQEFYSLPNDLAKILSTKKYGRLIAVGTTTLRVLETIFQKTQGRFNQHLTGATDLFLFPPYKIQSIDGLITNFHLPSSSLLMLTSCLLDRKKLLSVYQKAMEQGYRFYSYGDAMFIENSFR